MKTSSKARYSLHLVIDIAQHAGAGPVSLREVALRQNLSLKYLEQLAKALAQAGFLTSVRGAAGGYCLSRSASDITAGDIMRASEGGFLPVTCIDPDAGVDCCPRQGLCGTARFWSGLRDVIDNYVDDVTIAELAELAGFVESTKLAESAKSADERVLS
ncbi:MAG: Rrf2 family transcriptional regulator [Coriobacteriales bacterium]|nr:Rrf2 family transcriptional regulator [Coriobacteriales bacterium]